jgi:hypothetical protein
MRKQKTQKTQKIRKITTNESYEILPVERIISLFDTILNETAILRKTGPFIDDAQPHTVEIVDMELPYEFKRLNPNISTLKINFTYQNHSDIPFEEVFDLNYLDFLNMFIEETVENNNFRKFLIYSKHSEVVLNISFIISRDKIRFSVSGEEFNITDNYNYNTARLVKELTHNMEPSFLVEPYINNPNIYRQQKQEQRTKNPIHISSQNVKHSTHTNRHLPVAFGKKYYPPRMTEDSGIFREAYPTDEYPTVKAVLSKKKRDTVMAHATKYGGKRRNKKLTRKNNIKP